MKPSGKKFEDRLARIEDTTGEHDELSGRYPLLSLVPPPGYEGSVIKRLSKEGRGFLRRRMKRERGAGSSTG